MLMNTAYVLTSHHFSLHAADLTERKTTPAICLGLRNFKGAYNNTLSTRHYKSTGKLILYVHKLCVAADIYAASMLYKHTFPLKGSYLCYCFTDHG